MGKKMGSKNDKLAIKKVILKTREKITNLIENEKVKLIDTSDSGEVSCVGVGEQPTFVMSIWYSDYGKEYLVVDHPNPISKTEYEKCKILFEEK